MEDLFICQRKVDTFKNTTMSYDIVRSGDIGIKEKVIYIVHDRQGNVIRYNYLNLKNEFISLADVSSLCVKILGKAQIFITNCSNKFVYLSNLNSGKKIKNYLHENISTFSHFNEKETKMISICHIGSLNIINLRNYKLIKKIKQHLSEH